MQAKAKTGLVCLALYTQCYTHTHIGDPLPISPASKNASRGPSFRKQNDYFSASGILLSTSGNSNLSQWNSALRQRTISYPPAESKELCADNVKKCALLSFHSNAKHFSPQQVALYQLWLFCIFYVIQQYPELCSASIQILQTITNILYVTLYCIIILLRLGQSSQPVKPPAILQLDLVTHQSVSMILMLTQPTLPYSSCGELMVVVRYTETAGYFI